MKALYTLLFLVLVYAPISYSQQLVVINQTDCDLYIDLDENCGARTGGPYDAPALQTSYSNFSDPNINHGNDVETFVIELQSNGDNDIVKFTTNCQSPADTSPHTLDNSLIQCLTNDIVVEWQVNGSDFELDIHY